MSALQQEWDEPEEDFEEEELPKCACPYCHCSVRTDRGICDMCSTGAHQG